MDRHIICNFLLSPILPPALRQQAQRVTRSNEAPAPSPLLAAASSISKIVSSAPSSSAPASSAAAGVVVQGWDSARGATDGQKLATAGSPPASMSRCATVRDSARRRRRVLQTRAAAAAWHDPAGDGKTARCSPRPTHPRGTISPSPCALFLGLSRGDFRGMLDGGTASEGAARQGMLFSNRAMA